MERLQNWPDLRSRISKFWDIRFIDTGTDINRWKFQGDRSFGVAMTNIQSFSEVRSLDVTWWPDLEWPGSEIFTKCAEKMYEQLCQKRRRSTPPFSSYLRKTWRGCSNTPPARRGLMSSRRRAWLQLASPWSGAYVKNCCATRDNLVWIYLPRAFRCSVPRAGISYISYFLHHPVQPISAQRTHLV